MNTTVCIYTRLIIVLYGLLVTYNFFPNSRITIITLSQIFNSILFQVFYSFNKFTKFLFYSNSKTVIQTKDKLQNYLCYPTNSSFTIFFFFIFHATIISIIQFIKKYLTYDVCIYLYRTYLPKLYVCTFIYIFYSLISLGKNVK